MELKNSTIEDLSKEIFKMNKNLDRVIENILDSADAVVTALSSNTKGANAMLMNFRRRNKEYQEEQKKLRQANKLEIEVAHERIKQEMKQAQTIKDLESAYKSHLATLRDKTDAEKQALLDELATRRQELDQLRYKATLSQKFSNGLKFARDRALLFGNSLVNSQASWEQAWQAAKKTFSEFSMSVNTGIPLLEDYWATFEMGMSPEEVIKLKKEYLRSAAGFEGGMKGWSTAVGKIGDDMMSQGLTMSKEVASKTSASLLHYTQTLGVSSQRAKAVVEGQLIPMFKRMHNQLGMTAEEFADLHKTLTDDREAREYSLRMSAEEREQWFTGRVAFQEFLMSTRKFSKEQALAIQDFMKKLQGETAKDRMKRALKTQALMGMMGVGGGEEAAGLIRKGKLSADEQARLSDLMGSMSKKAEGIRGSGMLHAEMAIDTMNEKTGGIINESRVMNDSMNASLKVQEESKTILGKIETWLRENVPSLVGWVQKLGAIFESGIGKLITVFGALLMGKFIMKMFQAVLGGLGQRSAVGAGVSAAKDAASSFMNSARWTQFKGWVTGGFKAMGEGMKNWSGRLLKLMGSIKSGFGSILKGLGSATQAMMSAARSAASGLGNMMGGGGKLMGGARMLGGAAAVAGAGYAGYQAGSWLYNEAGLGDWWNEKLRDWHGLDMPKNDPSKKTKPEVAEEAGSEAGTTDMDRYQPEQDLNLKAQKETQSILTNLNTAIKELVDLQRTNNEYVAATAESNEEVSKRLRTTRRSNEGWLSFD